ncbi:glycosyltransferase family 4 protein [Pedobacter sp. NJ-S-72]
MPFLEEELTEKDIQNWKTFEEREGFVFIGNYLHEPNWNTLQILKTKIWPALRKKLPGAKLNIYGAYSSQKVMQLHNEKEKFYVHGRADDALEVIADNRILLAPIQFGAGMKGKFIDAMIVGTPSVTTAVGAEAMSGNLEWNGAIEDDFKLFTDQAAKLYQDKNWWLTSQQNGVRIINERYGKSQFTKAFTTMINTLSLNLTAHRQQNFFGQILMHHTVNSTKYMSLWIEEKNAKKKIDLNSKV